MQLVRQSVELFGHFFQREQQRNKDTWHSEVDPPQQGYRQGCDSAEIALKPQRENSDFASMLSD